MTLLEEIRGATAEAITEHFDVLIVDTGISGIGGAYHLTTQCATITFVVLKAKGARLPTAAQRGGNRA